MINNELTHHGIKGMRWGVRRYQNKDGSLTPAGKKREAEAEYKQVKKGTATETGAKVKKAATIGAAITTTVLAAYGGYKVSEFLNSCSYTVNGAPVSRKEFVSAIDTVIKSL